MPDPVRESIYTPFRSDNRDEYFERLEDRMGELGESRIAERVSVESRVILHRGECTPKQFLRFRNEGVYEPGTDGSTCELIAGTVCIAAGKLVKRNGRWCMQVEEIGEERE